jgi:hypothetical protein
MKMTIFFEKLNCKKKFYKFSGLEKQWEQLKRNGGKGTKEMKRPESRSYPEIYNNNYSKHSGNFRYIF